ncbi:MAG TPA: hydantoinase/oxoprolinase family protein, partial [Cyclobacteriaceae bacterium]|nr:hydantoinase/oxoprolinase family protein [Cyclobacteriaceae bacterium]
MSNNSPPWRIWIDTGGTFTDCISVNPNGNIQRLKVLSSSVLRGKVEGVEGKSSVRVSVNWPVSKDIFKGFTFRVVGTSFASKIQNVDFASGTILIADALPRNTDGRTIEITSHEEVPVLASRLLTETPLDSSFPFMEVKLGSTRGTNAILERKGAKTALLVTKGFKDLLLIGNQQRQDLFAINIIKQKPLYHAVIEVDERIEASGDVLRGLHQKSIEKVIRSLKKQKIDSVAIALINSFRNPVHEIMLSRALEVAGFPYCSVSSLLSSQIKILPRAETSVVNAYLDPIIQSYVDGIERKLSGNAINIMTSAGSLVKSNSFFPKDSLLSGPAGGVVGAAGQATRSGIKKIIAFDMGGTSTDVSLYNDRFDYRFESRVGNFKILSPSLAIETIAAGGGSICDFDGHKLIVGPHSAGAVPGPACYGAGGPLTITDINVLLGRIDPDRFAIPIDKTKSKAALDALAKKVKKQTGHAVKPLSLLNSLIQIANEKMAEAIKKISVQEGNDPREFTLLSFGGAGGQHACALAGILDMTRVLIPYDAGLLSAYGIGHAFAERFEEKLLLRPFTPIAKELHGILESLFNGAKEALVKDGHREQDVIWKKTLIFLRFAGQDSPLEIDYRPGDDILASFREKYISIFGHWIEREVEVESIKVIASIKSQAGVDEKRPSRKYKPVPEGRHPMVAGAKQVSGNVFVWEQLTPGASIIGPALVTSENSTTFIDENWEWFLDEMNNAHLT